MAVVPAPVYKVFEHWLNKGSPKEAWSKAGPFWMRLSKMLGGSWMGSETGELAIRDLLDGNAGPNSRRAFANGGNIGGSRFRPVIREYHAFLTFDELQLVLLRNPAAQITQLGELQDSMLQIEQGAHRTMSYLSLGDGTGRIAKGDGAFNINGNTITFLNRLCYQFFEIGDVLAFVDEATPVPTDGQPATRAVVTPVVVTNVLRSGSIVTNAADLQVAVPTIASTDYIGKESHFDSSDSQRYKGMVDGVKRWNPITETEAQTMLFGVNRSINTQRRSGTRILLTGGESAFDVFVLIVKAAMEISSDIMTIMIPLARVTDLMAESKANGITWTSSTSKADPKVMTFGATEYHVVGPGISAKVIVDPFWLDPNVTENDDYTFYAYPEGCWHLDTADGWGWKNYGTDGRILSTPGDKDLNAKMGYYGNMFNDVPAHGIITSIRADQ